MPEPDDDAARGGPARALELQAVDVDGVRTVAVGTILFAVATVLTIVFRDELREQDRDWWTWTCLAGFGLGVLGYEYCRSRRSAIARLRAAGPAAVPTGTTTDGSIGGTTGEAAAAPPSPEAPPRDDTSP